MPAEKKAELYTVTSPLATLPGVVKLPMPDDFSGLMWRDWRQAVEDTDAETVNRLYGYAGARFIKKHGTWGLTGMTLAEFLKWESNPAEERMKPVSWLGRTMQTYINLVIDPKE